MPLHTNLFVDVRATILRKNYPLILFRSEHSNLNA